MTTAERATEKRILKKYAELAKVIQQIAETYKQPEQAPRRRTAKK